MNQQERINKYLNQEMDAAAQTRFEAEMAANSDLSDAVDLQRDLTSFFQDSAPALEAILTEEGGRHFQEETGKKGFSQWKWLLPILVIPLGFVVWWSQQSSPKAPSISKERPSTKEKESPFFADTISDIPSPILEEELPQSSPKESEEQQQNNPPKINTKRELIASANPANFQRNSVIESIMAEQVRDAGSSTELEIPTQDTTFSFAKNIPFKVSGTTTITPPYTLSIYSNRVFDFENDYKVLSSSLTGTQQEEKYRFSFNATVPFPKGLYYLFLQSEEEEEILVISRFKVE